jgi:RNA polymerase sigma-70 factor (ECF subfamily)
MNVNNIEDKNRILKAQQFDEDALAEIYDTYSPALYRYAMRLLGNQQFAEDCVSETFLRLLKIFREEQGIIDHLQSYLYRVAHNWIMDFYRRKQNSLEETETSEEVAAPGASTIDQVEKNIRANQVRQMILSLPPEQQQVIILKYLEGLDNEEIARLLNKKNGAVRALVFRAVNALRMKMKLLEKLDVI